MPVEVSGLTAKKGKGEILEELLYSTRQTNVLGIFFEGEEEMITTSVTGISDDGTEQMVHFQPMDLHGYPIEKNPVKLSEIRSVIHFNTLFNDPVYVKIRERRLGRKDDLAA